MKKVSEEEMIEALEEAEILESAVENPSLTHMLKIAQRLCGGDKDMLERLYESRKP